MLFRSRGIKFYAHPGANLSKKAGKWVVVAELVQTARLFGRGIAAIDPKWLEEVGAHLLKRQLLEPHWEKKSGHVVALERATLYGLTVYSQRRVRYDRIDPELNESLNNDLKALIIEKDNAEKLLKAKRDQLAISENNLRELEQIRL